MDVSGTPVGLSLHLVILGPLAQLDDLRVPGMSRVVALGHVVDVLVADEGAVDVLILGEGAVPQAVFRAQLPPGVAEILPVNNGSLETITVASSVQST